MTAELGSGLYFGAQPVINVFVLAAVAEPPSFEFGGVAPAETLAYPYARDDPGAHPHSYVTEFNLVFDVLPTDLRSYLSRCLRAASTAGDSMAWLGFEGSFGFDDILSDADAPQIYGVCAPGGEPVVATDLDALKTPEWRSIISSFRSQL